jgi:CBS domain-containing protein
MMKVKDIMTSEPRSCSPEASAADAAGQMWEGDCGILPVAEGGKLIGVVTDRDLFIALATQNRQASELRVGEVAARNVATCGPEDDVSSALATMKTHRIRRLPVVGFGDALVGILSLNDIVRASGHRPGVPGREVIDTLQAICGAHHPAPHVVAV